MYVFPNAHGGRANYSNVVRRIWRPALAKAKVQRTNVYQLRHLCGTRLLEKYPGFDHAVAALMGHTNASTTRQYYARAHDRELRRLVDENK